MEDYQTAIAHYQNLIAQAPNDAKLYLALSTYLVKSGQIDEALVVAKQAQIHADENFKSQCLLQIAKIYLQQERFEMAEKLFHQLIQNSSHLVEASISLANLYLKIGSLSKAHKALKVVENLAKDDANFVMTLALVIFQMRQTDSAIDLILQFFKKNGVRKDMLSNALMSSNYTAKHGFYQEQLKVFFKEIYPNKNSISAPDKKDKIRIGFVSADFCWHPVGYFLHSFLPYLSEFGIEIYLYYNASKTDSITEKLQKFSKKFINISALDVDAATTNIRADNLHLLIDLSGHSAGNRLDIFDKRAAAIQASYLGYTDSTYLPNMDYLISDEIHIPANEQLQYPEKIIYLPKTRFCFELPMKAFDIAPAPFLTNGYLTLGNFSNPAKISKETIQIWAQIMLKIPNARLKLQHKEWDDYEFKKSLLQEFAEFGIAQGRLEFHGQSKYDNYLLSYQEIDVILDTTPFCSATTTCEALLMGVPTITFTGNIAASRQGVSILKAVGEENFIANDAKNAVKILQELQEKPEIIKIFKEQIREKIAKSELGNGRLFAENFAKLVNKILTNKEFKN